MSVEPAKQEELQVSQQRSVITLWHRHLTEGWVGFILQWHCSGIREPHMKESQGPEKQKRGMHYVMVLHAQLNHPIPVHIFDQATWIVIAIKAFTWCRPHPQNVLNWDQAHWACERWDEGCFPAGCKIWAQLSWGDHMMRNNSCNIMFVQCCGHLLLTMAMGQNERLGTKKGKV